MTTIYIREGTPLPRRRRHELYKTELALVRAAVKEYAFDPAGDPVLDPGAGDGRWGQTVKALYPLAEIHGVERRRVLRPEGFELWASRKDFLSFRPKTRYGLILGNPPYGPLINGVLQAELFIRHAWDLLENGGRLLFLLRLAMQAGIDRYEGLWTTHPPTLVATVSRRPSFGKNRHGRRGTNGTDYGLYLWNKGLDGRPEGTPRAWPTELFYYEPDKNEGDLTS